VGIGSGVVLHVHLGGVMSMPRQKEFRSPAARCRDVWIAVRRHDGIEQSVSWAIVPRCASPAG